MLSSVFGTWWIFTPLVQVQGNEGAVFSPGLPVCRISPQKTQFSPRRRSRQGSGTILEPTNPQGDTARSSLHSTTTPHAIVRKPTHFQSYSWIVQNILPLFINPHNIFKGPYLVTQAGPSGIPGSRDFKSAKILGFLKLKSLDFLSLCLGPLGTLLRQKSPKLENIFFHFL